MTMACNEMAGEVIPTSDAQMERIVDYYAGHHATMGSRDGALNVLQ